MKRFKKRISRIRLEYILAWAALLTVLGLVGFQMYKGSLTQVGLEEAPDFELITFNGERLKLSEYLGRVVVINFWASWCIPCREEARVLEAAWQEFRDEGVIFIGIDYADTKSEALAFIDEFGITYFNGPDVGSRISTAYRMRGVPETFFINRQGQIVSIFIGAISENEIRQRIEALLSQ